MSTRTRKIGQEELSERALGKTHQDVSKELQTPGPSWRERKPKGGTLQRADEYRVARSQERGQWTGPYKIGAGD